MLKKTVSMLVLSISAITATKAQLADKLAIYPGYIQYKIYAIAQTTQLDEEKQLQLANYFATSDKEVQEMVKAKARISKLSNFYREEDKGLQKILTAKEFAGYMTSTSDRSQLLMAITMHKELALDDKQINTILARYNQAPSVKNKDGAIMKDWEDSQLSNLLGNEQLFTYIKSREKGHLNKQAAQQWQNLIKLELSRGVDSNRFKQDYVEFQTKKLYAIAMLKGKEAGLKRDSVDKSLYTSKPFLMRKQELYENIAPVKTQLAELINNREKLKLNPVQIDSLVNRTYNLMGLIGNESKKNKTANSPVKSYERNAMGRILTNQQLEDFLTMKYKAQAQEDAADVWGDLQKNGLVNGVDKTTALKDITAYELKLAIAKERNRIIGTKETAYQRKMAQAAKPDVLITLEEKKDQGKTNTAAKRRMAW